MDFSILTRQISNVDVPFDQVLKNIRGETRKAKEEMHKSYPERIAKTIALKIANAALMRTQYVRRHTRVIAKPVGMLVDPANTCQLKCPGCIHGKETLPTVWDKQVMRPEVYARLIGEYGPTALGLLFFNWGEPLINRRLPNMIAEARSLAVGAKVSSNMSLGFDVRALVASGLPWLTASIDGVSQSVMEIYRRGSRAQTIFDNIRKLVEEKKRVGSYLPVIDWQYLMFDHNLHEMAQAEEFARELGVNQIRFTPSYALPGTGITLKNVPRARTVVFDLDQTKLGEETQKMMASLSPSMDDAYEEFITQELPADFVEDTSRKNVCLWLYDNPTVDANGRFMPCCGLSESNWIFSNAGQEDAFNSDMYRSARSLSPSLQTACHGCPSAQSGSFRLQYEGSMLGRLVWRMDHLKKIPVRQLEPIWTANSVAA